MPSYENTAINFIANFQYLVVCMVFSISKPFRQPLYSNLWFTLSLVILLAFNTYINLSDDEFITTLLMVERDVSMEFRLATLIVVVINTILTYGFERIIVWYVSIWYKNHNDRKVHRQQRLEIEGQQKMQTQAALKQVESGKDFVPMLVMDDITPLRMDSPPPKKEKSASESEMKANMSSSHNQHQNSAKKVLDNQSSNDEERKENEPNVDNKEHQLIMR